MKKIVLLMLALSLSVTSLFAIDYETALEKKVFPYPKFYMLTSPIIALGSENIKYKNGGNDSHLTLSLGFQTMFMYDKIAGLGAEFALTKIGSDSSSMSALTKFTKPLFYNTSLNLLGGYTWYDIDKEQAEGWTYGASLTYDLSLAMSAEIEYRTGSYDFDESNNSFDSDRYTLNLIYRF